ncbi:MAG: S-formylglutathione hydrolase [Halobacteriovoraceae bacterium]|nr:S-formylglutathione hydrolase [Halobacteriovoraceae bacterium]|tara:strand:- start:11720 stop:12550 length:831 start_codon:yes stop_codon:yes gene_type:complete
MPFEILKKHKTFDGETLFCEHQSASTKTKMKFSVYLPKPVEEIDSAIIWLSGLTCNEENFITKAGAQRNLAGTNTMIICPDTSPRGLEIPGAEDDYDFGTGAGFYVNATTESYRENYQMYDYIVKDIVGLLKSDFKVQKLAISGHSMGGHGALVIGLREPQLFTSVSAFSPIVNPVESPWGHKAFTGYLGDNREEWKKYDACELIKAGHSHPQFLLVDQGLGDEFLAKQLLSKNLENACENREQKVQLNFHEDYDHSYYFISTFIGKHIEFHVGHF